jgi:hypothetical protein
MVDDKKTTEPDATTPEGKPGRDLKPKIREWLMKNGYPMEMQVADVFHKAGYLVEQSQYYQNKENVPCEIDVIASRTAYTDAISEIHVVVECKSNPKVELPWVVFSCPADNHSELTELYYLLLTDVARVAFANALSKGTIKDLPLLMKFGERVGYGVQCAQIYEGRSNEDLAYRGVVKLVNSAVFKLQPVFHPDVATIVVPVLTVRTPLFECWLEPDGVKLEQRDHLMLTWHRPSDVEPIVGQTVIHVVHQDGLEAFAKKATQLFETLAITCKAEVIAAAKRSAEQRNKAEAGAGPVR